MSSKEVPDNSRDEILAARKTKKLTKQKTRNKTGVVMPNIVNDAQVTQKSKDEIKENNGKKEQNTTTSKIPLQSHENEIVSSGNIVSPQHKNKVENAGKKLDLCKIQASGESSENKIQNNAPDDNKNLLHEKAFTNKNEKSPSKLQENENEPIKVTNTPKSKDEVDKATFKLDVIKMDKSEKTKEQIKAERAAKKAAKQAKKKETMESGNILPEKEMTVKDVVETLKDIANVAKEVQDVTAKVKAIHLDVRKPEETNKAKEKIDSKAEEVGKSKAELRAERRAKQEAQRAAKQAALEQKNTTIIKTEQIGKSSGDSATVKKEKSPKKVADKAKVKIQSIHRANWFQHLYSEHDKESLNKIPLNSNLHPAIVKLGVQLATRVVTGSNARCIALLDALKKMVSDYTLPAKTEFGRGLEAHLAVSLQYLWRMRQPSASQTNALNYFRHHLTQLPNNVDEFDAKKKLQEEIDRYIREQIDMAGEAISQAVRKKISDGDHILTYGCSSLVERIISQAWESGARFHMVVAGAGGAGGGRELLRRLTVRGVPCSYLDISALSYAMKHINKVLLGASGVLGNGCVVQGAGAAQAALVARAHNVPVLVACETHKFTDRVHTDAFVYNEIGDPDELIDTSEDVSPLKNWRSNANLAPLNLCYDVTPPSLVTALVTELAILPCSSAPVVLRFKLSEYGM